MNETKRTPGPWRHTRAKASVMKGDRIVAFIQDCPERAANATLIAAAPGLLTICEKIAKWSQTPDTEEGGEFNCFAEELVPELFAAIAAAKGGTS